MTQFSTPTTNKELVNGLKKMNEKTFFLGGGTDLAIYLKNSMLHEFSIIDLTKIKENKEIILSEKTIEIGSAVTISELLLSKTIQHKLPSLWETSNSLRSTQIRNRATLGGNVANASQSADTLPVLLALNASCILINKNGSNQKEPILDYLLSLKKNPLSEKRVLTKIIIPLRNTYSSFSKLGDKQSVTIAKINFCISFDKIKEEQILNPIVYLGAVGQLPIRGKLIEKTLNKQVLNKIQLSELKNAVKKEINQAIPNRVSKYYKRQAAFGLILDTLDKIRTQKEAIPNGKI